MSGGLFCGMSCAKREQIPSTIRVISSFFIKISFHLRRSATRDLNLARVVGGDGHANRCKTMFPLIILLRKRRNEGSENEINFVRCGGALPIVSNEQSRAGKRLRASPRVGGGV